MRFGVLGPVAIQNGADWDTPRGALQRTLLGTLLAHAGRAVSVDLLAEAMWGAQAADPRVAGRVQLHVHRLRQLLDDPARLRNDQGRYRIDLDEGELDALEFEDLVVRAMAEDHDPERVIALADEGLALWRGPAFEGVQWEECTAEADRLEQRRLELREARFVAHLELGREDQIRGDLTQLAQQHPLRERLQELLMLALDRAGRRSDALQVYRDTHHLLAEELGIDPGPRLRELHERILTGEEEPAEVGTTPTPAQLPPAPPRLLGREADLDRLDRLTVSRPHHEGDGSAAEGEGDPRSARHLLRGAGVVVVTGTPGAGKTALVLQWGHEHAEDYPDGQLYCDLRGFSAEEPLDPHEVLAMFLTSLGARPGSMPTLQERQAMLRSLLARRRMLLVLDNAASTEQVRPLLPGSTGCQVLVTTRRELTGLSARDGASHLTLEPLESVDSLSLLRQVAGDEALVADAVWAELADGCGHLPLALNIAAEQVRGRPEAEILEFLEELTDRSRRLDSLETDDDPGSDVRHVLSWSYRSLSEPAAEAFRALGVLPGQTVDRRGLAALTGQDLRLARRSLAELGRAHLVDERQPGVFGQHDLLAAYAAELALAQIDEKGWSSARRALLAHYAAGLVVAREVSGREWEFPRAELPDLPPAPDLPGADAVSTWLDWEVPNILAAVREAPVADDALVVHISFMLGAELEDRAQFPDALSLRRAGLQAARRLGDLGDEATMELGIGGALYEMGDMLAAIPHLERGLEQATEVGDTHGRAEALNNLSNVFSRQGRFQKALTHLRESVELTHGLGDHHNTVIVRNNVISTLIRAGRFAEAQTEAQDLQAYVHRHGTLTEEASLLENSARAHLGLGAPDRALTVAEEALEAAGQRGQRSREARIGCVMGQAMLALGDAAAATALFREALRVGRRLGDRRVMIEALQGWGQASADPAEARDLLIEALTLARSTGHQHNVETLERLLADD